MTISLFHLFEIKIEKKTLFINLFKNFLFIFIYLFIYIYQSQIITCISNKYVNILFSNNSVRLAI